MRYAYRRVNFKWLGNADDATFHPGHGDIIDQPYPQTFENCDTTFTKIDLSFGFSIFQVKHKFHEGCRTEAIDIAEINSDLGDGAFMVQAVDRGRIWHKESYPETDLEYAPGHDLFRFADRVQVRPRVACAEDCVMTALTISRSSLSNLLEGEAAERLLQALGLLPAPKVVVRSMPLTVSQHLHNLVPGDMTGALLRLACHSRVVEYLSALLTHLGCDAAVPNPSSGHKRAFKVYEMLMQTSGKLPSLDEIAAEFAISARTLSNEFKAEYGQPIHAFMTDLRLNQAHAAIEANSAPLKSLAQRLGYTHTHHFLTAFRRKFGYPPSALRKK